MVEYYQQGECVDGHRVQITTRKLESKSFSLAPTGFKGLKYNCSLNSKSIIDTPLSIEDEKTAKIGIVLGGLCLLDVLCGFLELC